MNAIQNHPFSFFFIDDLLPDCFGQKNGMTFRSLLTDEPITDKITYDGIKRSFQNLHAEFESFEDFYKKLKTITNRNDFFATQIIGKNKKTHTRGNNLFELVFSQDGRMDVSIIQTDGIKCVLILDVRISNHYDRTDCTVHAKNDLLAKRILSALDERNIHKTPSMVENDAAFKNGLIAYQNGLLGAINTTEAKFEILLNTLDAIIFSNKSIEAKKSLFFDKLYDITQDLNMSEQKKFDEFVEQQLTSNNIKQYQKELLQKLWYVNQFDESEKNDLLNRFNKIKIAKTFVKPFLNQILDILENDNLNNKTIMDIYRVFNKIPATYLYILQDELNDIDTNIQNPQTPLDISVLSSQKQTELFLEHLIHLKTHYKVNIYPHFKKICEDYHKERLDALELNTKHIAPSQKTIDEMLYIPMDHLSDKDVIDTLGYGLMQIIIKKNPSMQSLIDTPKNENILNHSNTLGYQWFCETTNNETLLNALDRLILTPNKQIENMIYKHYPFLANYITAFRQNKSIPDTKLHNIYHGFKHYTSEEEFDNVYSELKTLSAHEQTMLRSYFSSDYAKTSEDTDIGAYILGTLELIDLEIAQKQKKNPKKEQAKHDKENEKTINKQMRQAFEDTFNTFLSDVDSNEKKQALKDALASLNEAVLNGLKTLPKNDIIGIFIRNYIQETSKKQSISDTPPISSQKVVQTANDQNILAFNMALTPVILHAREIKKTSIFNAINTFFDNPNQIKNNQNLERLCTSLSKNDWNYLISACEQNPTLYSKEKLFLNMYQQNSCQHFTAFLNCVQHEYDLLLAHAQKKRIIQFETALNAALFSSDTKTSEHLLCACEVLTKEDIKTCLSDRNMNILAKILLQKIAPVIEQKMANPRERLKTHIETIKRLNAFRNTFTSFSNDVESKKYRGLLIKKYLQLSAQDIEIFVELTTNDVFNHNFFKKLLKNKRKHKDFNKQHEGIITIIDTTIKKLKLYDAISSCLYKMQKNADKKLVDCFLALTENDNTELSEILSECKDNPLVVFFLKKMKDTKKNTVPSKQKQNLLDVFEKSNWLIDFYHSMKHSMMSQNAAQKLYQQEQTQENSEAIQIINYIMKLQIAELSLQKISTILYANIFDRNTLVHDQIIKDGFYKAVMQFKNNPIDKKTHVNVIAFSNELQDSHYTEIIQEYGETNSVTQFIQEFKKYSENDSLDKLRRNLGEQKYQHHFMNFLQKKAREELTQNIKKIKQRQRD